MFPYERNPHQSWWKSRATGVVLPLAAIALLYLALVLTVVSGAQYLIDGRRVRLAPGPGASCATPPARAGA